MAGPPSVRVKVIAPGPVSVAASTPVVATRRPIVAGNTLAALEVKDLGMQKQKMTLRRWDLATGKELPAKELLESKALWSRVQEDGRYLFVHPALVALRRAAK